MLGSRPSSAPARRRSSASRRPRDAALRPAHPVSPPALLCCSTQPRPRRQPSVPSPTACNGSRAPCRLAAVALAEMSIRGHARASALVANSPASVPLRPRSNSALCHSAERQVAAALSTSTGREGAAHANWSLRRTRCCGEVFFFSFGPHVIEIRRTKVKDTAEYVRSL